MKEAQRNTRLINTADIQQDVAQSDTDWSLTGIRAVGQIEQVEHQVQMCDVEMFFKAPKQLFKIAAFNRFSDIALSSFHLQKSVLSRRALLRYNHIPNNHQRITSNLTIQSITKNSIRKWVILLSVIRFCFQNQTEKSWESWEKTGRVVFLNRGKTPFNPNSYQYTHTTQNTSHLL